MTAATQLTVGKVILAGVFGVVVPTMALITTAIFILSDLVGFTLGEMPGTIFYICLFLAVALGWLWWSISVPRWRLWALERADDWPRVKWWAVATGIVWTDKTSWGRLMGRTEIKSADHAKRERELEMAIEARRQSPERVR
ncbi:hypothetical protein [Hypericibacter sp.]|uniref:hypothetical protein n=1 Tax=Hypericibacter sp. TaxID=2705401 RepID=UPI003D6C9765